MHSLEIAHKTGDAELSRELHRKNAHIKHESYHTTLGNDVIKSVIYGGLDGIITTFSVICSAYASHLSPHIIFVMGVANVLADGMSMGHGDYFSEKVENDYVISQYKREQWEMDNYLEGEISEMVELYKTKYSIPEEEARSLLEGMANTPKLFLDHMMVVELDLMPPDGTANPLKNGIVTFSSFIVFGFIPLIVYRLLESFIWACGATVLSLAALGWLRASFTRSNPIRSMVITVFNGGCSAVVAYGVSDLLLRYA